MPTATLEDYLARMSPYLPKQQAPVQAPQAQAINPLQLMVAQQLMSALQPQRSVTPAVPKNSMWITPQMIQGAAQTNVAEQRLGQEDQAMAQSQMAQMLQNQMAQERTGLERAQLQNQLNQPGAAEQAKLHMVGQILASQMTADRQAEYDARRLQEQKDLEIWRAGQPPTERDKAYIDYMKALTGKTAGGGAGGAGGMDPYKVTALVNAGVISPQQGNKILTEAGVVAEPSFDEFVVNAALAQQKQRATASKANAEIAKNTGPKQMSEATARFVLNNVESTEEHKAAAKAVLGLAPAGAAGGAVPGEESYAERRKRLGR